MSVPLALVALLATDDAYGLQLHKELAERLVHRSKTNVGQIYSTLERLVRDALIEQHGSTTDGLPLYRATQLGTARTKSWLAGETLTNQIDWTEFLDITLLSATLPGKHFETLCARFPLETANDSIAELTVGDKAHTHLLAAMNATFDDIALARSLGTVTPHGLSATRPTRGRRPRSA